MARKAKNIKEQIELLKKRGMIFEDEDKAEQILEAFIGITSKRT